MSGKNQPSLQQIDWSALPAPIDDGGAQHLEHAAFPELSLPATDGNAVNISALSGLTVIFIYPMTGRPDVALPENWDMIPGARGCTPQACAFRDLRQELKAKGVDHLYGLSTQSTSYQKEAANRLHLPFPLLSDEKLQLTRALDLPTLQVEGMTLLRRLTLAIRNGTIEKHWYPVFPPDESPQAVLDWLTESAKA